MKKFVIDIMTMQWKTGEITSCKQPKLENAGQKMLG